MINNICFVDIVITQSKFSLINYFYSWSWMWTTSPIKCDGCVMTDARLRVEWDQLIIMR